MRYYVVDNKIYRFRGWLWLHSTGENFLVKMEIWTDSKH